LTNYRETQLKLWVSREKCKDHFLRGVINRIAAVLSIPFPSGNKPFIAALALDRILIIA
jgi:uncharacterized iron-regulated membrane protein